MVRKGIVKVSSKYFKPHEIDKIALVAPNATLIIIKNFKVVEKTKVGVPDQVENIVKCFNPNCITNHESINTSFSVIDKRDMKLKCRYCEKITARENITFF